MNPPWKWCALCDRRHRMGRPCPPEQPSVPGLERLSAWYWFGLNAEMRAARSVEIVGLSDCLSRTRSGKLSGPRDVPGAAGTARALADTSGKAADMRNATQPEPHAHDEAA